MNLILKRFTKSGSLLSLLLLATMASGGGTIADIKITGNKKVEADAILNALKVKKGDTWTESQIAAEIKTLFGLGYFSDLRISKEDTSAGQVIIISVIEKPSIVSIKYEGLKEFT
jgi:outer membrane protein insertion porin family